MMSKHTAYRDSLTPGRVTVLALAAGAVHLACDLAAAKIPFAAPPYLLFSYMPEAFRDLSPLGVSIAASAVNGVIAAIAFAAVPTARRRPVPLGCVLFAFWAGSGLCLALVWLSGAGWRAITGLAFGAPRALAAAAVLLWLRPGPGQG